MKKTLVFLGILAGVLGRVTPGFAEDPMAKYHTNKAARIAVKPAPAAAPNADLVEVKDRLDKLLKGQDDILQRLEEMKKELYIVKIRATKR